MPERENISSTGEADIERSSEVIRQDIAKGEENISHTVDEISSRIKEKLDWHEYVKDSPYLALGAAAGLGYIASGIFITRTASMERIMGSVSEEVRRSLSAGRPSMIKATLLTVALKAADVWLKKIISTPAASCRSGSISENGSEIHQKPDMSHY